jgi:hypothetical protein
MKPLTLFLIYASISNGFSINHRSALVMSVSKENFFSKAMKSVSKSAMPVFIIGAIVLADPFKSFAASSGGRSGDLFSLFIYDHDSTP